MSTNTGGGHSAVPGGFGGLQTGDATHAVEGPAFPPLVKALAVGLVAGMLVWGGRAADALLGPQGLDASALAIVGVALCLVLWCLVWILRSRTRLDGTHIWQSWMWNKRVALADITQAKLIAVPGLEWLVAPRLVVRARGRGLLVFHAADRQVLRALARLCFSAA